MRVVPLGSIADDLDRILLPGLSFQPPAADLIPADGQFDQKAWTRQRRAANHAREVEHARAWLKARG